MHDPGSRNGVIEAWLDCDRVLSRTDLEFRDSRAWGINMLLMDFLFGGNSAEWWHGKEETVHFDDFVVHAVR